MRKVMMVGALGLVAACGGSSVSGPVGSACLSAGRSAANPVLCGCVQSVANQTLTAAEQRRAAQFFSEPDKAQETRTSDNPASRSFWTRYRAFSDAATRSCG